MNKLLILIAFSIILINRSFACDCVTVSDSSFKNVIKESDFVFTGVILKSNHWDQEHREYNDSKTQGSNVLIVIDSLIKGDLAIGDTVYLYQFFSSGNCTEIFDYGSKQLIFGNSLESVEQIISDDQIVYETGPEPYESDTIMTNNDYSQEIIEFLNSQLSKSLIVETGMCLSFSSMSEDYKQVLELLKK